MLFANKSIEVLIADGRVNMTGPSGSHSVLLVEKHTDEYLGITRGRAIVHLIGFMETNKVGIEEIARAVTHLKQGTIDSFSARDTFCHAEFRKGLVCAWKGLGSPRKGIDTYGRNGYHCGRTLLNGGYVASATARRQVA